MSDDVDDVGGLVEKLADKRPDAILLAAGRGPVVRALLAALRRRLPRTTVVGSPPLADSRAAGSARAVTGVLPVAAQSSSARRLAARLGTPREAEALYGYDAAALVLSALRTAGADRAGVLRAALRPGRHAGATGRFEVSRAGSVARPSLAVVPPRRARAHSTGASLIYVLVLLGSVVLENRTTHVQRRLATSPSACSSR